MSNLQPIIFVHNQPIWNDPLINDFINAATIENIESATKDSGLLIINTSEKSLGIKDVKQLVIWNAKSSGNNLRMAVIEQSDKLTTEAQNSLLKTLEEPSPNSLIILLINNPTILLPTVLSRSIVLGGAEEQTNVATYNDRINEYMQANNLAERIQIIEGLVKLPDAKKITEFICLNLMEKLTNQDNWKDFGMVRDVYIMLLNNKSAPRLTLELIAIILNRNSN